MKNHLIIAGIITLIVINLFGIFNTKESSFGGQVGSSPTIVSASSTTFTLTTTSQRLLATSSPKRLGAIISSTNCTSGSAVYISANRDIVATANTGIAITASSSLSLADYPNVPAFQGSVQGITGVGTCTVLVTEWRSQY